jgi:hypothetical protein
MNLLRLTRLPVLLAIVASLGVSAGGCGYALAGRGNALPPHIKIIGVPGLTNLSTTPGIEEVISREIRTEMSGRGGVRVLPEEGNADGVLTGSIVSVDLRPVVVSDARTVSQVTLIVVANVEFKDKKDGKVLWANPRVITQETYNVDAAANAVDAAALFRQDANAMQRLAKVVARSIVTQIFEAF